MRYLIISDHGILGAAVFAASALALRERDQWIGWDRDTRLRHLHRIVGLSRYLVRPAVHCQNLASKALSLCLRRLPADFQQRYNYRPWLVETFADTSQHSGTCFRAANFTYLEFAKMDRDDRGGAPECIGLLVVRALNYL